MNGRRALYGADAGPRKFTRTHHHSLWIIGPGRSDNDLFRPTGLPPARGRMKDVKAEKDIRAAQILKALIEGMDPRTGEALSGESVLQQAEVLRALLAAVAALERSAARAQRRSLLPDNVGRSWTGEEENKLIAAFKAGELPPVLARKHRRTLRAVEARLERLGLLSADQRLTRDGFPGVSDARPRGLRGPRRMRRAILARKRPQRRAR